MILQNKKYLSRACIVYGYPKYLCFVSGYASEKRRFPVYIEYTFILMRVPAYVAFVDLPRR